MAGYSPIIKLWKSGFDYTDIVKCDGKFFLYSSFPKNPRKVYIRIGNKQQINMIPAGYMFKRVLQRPAWLSARAVVDIYSVSGCISDDFADYFNYWKHNGYWLFDSPDIMESLANSEKIDLSGTTLFYYEIYEYEFDDNSKKWVAFAPEDSFITNIRVPIHKYLQGFDVVTFVAHTSPECSPLSCNLLAETIPVNQHCLFNTFEEAKNAIEQGLFENSEPGPYRIFAVYTIGD